MINGIGQNIEIRSIPFLSHKRIPENFFSLVLNGKMGYFYFTYTVGSRSYAIALKPETFAARVGSNATTLPPIVCPLYFWRRMKTSSSVDKLFS